MSATDKINAVLKWVDADARRPTLGVKANISVASHACHGGIKAYEKAVADKDAYVVSALKKGGFSINSILNMEEGALGAQTDNPWFGKTHNPLKYGYTPGGSSGGSAAAVAAGLCQMALGTDTMGSVRIPSAYCGLFGFKPSHSKLFLEGVMPLSPTLDTVGVHARSLEECQAAMEVMKGQKLVGTPSRDIHVLDWRDRVECEPSILSGFHDFIEKHGSFKTTRLEPYGFGQSRRAGLILSEVEGYAFHKPVLEKNPLGFSDFFRGMLEYGAALPKDKVDAAYAHVKELRNADFPDFILMPTAPQTAFKFGDPVPANQADFTAFANLADRPAIAFPIGTGDNGLPISAQLVGPRGRDADLVATLRALLS